MPRWSNEILPTKHFVYLQNPSVTFYFNVDDTWTFYTMTFSWTVASSVNMDDGCMEGNTVLHLISVKFWASCLYILVKHSVQFIYKSVWSQYMLQSGGHCSGHYGPRWDDQNPEWKRSRPLVETASLAPTQVLQQKNADIGARSKQKQTPNTHSVEGHSWKALFCLNLKSTDTDPWIFKKRPV